MFSLVKLPESDVLEVQWADGSMNLQVLPVIGGVKLGEDQTLPCEFEGSVNLLELL